MEQQYAIIGEDSFSLVKKILRKRSETENEDALAVIMDE